MRLTTLFSVGTACLYLSLTGCVPAIGLGAYETATVIREDRTTGTVIDDATINTTLQHRYFQKDIDNLFADVDVTVHEGRVLLTGVVEKQETVVDAVRMAWNVSGVKEVINELQSSQPTNLKQRSKDIWTSTHIRGRLLVTKGIKNLNYNIETVNSVVYILGVAQDKTELGHVTNIASRTKGVKKVVSHVRIKGQEPSE